MRVSVEVSASNADQSINVFFDTTVSVNKEPKFMQKNIERVAAGKFRTFMKNTDSDVLAELSEFNVRYLV